MKYIRNIEELNKQIQYIQKALQNTDENNRISHIEYDIILDKLRFIYEQLQNSEFSQQCVHVVSDDRSDETPAGGDAEPPIPMNMEELIEKPFMPHPAVDKSIIESLYGEEILEPHPKESVISETVGGEENAVESSSRVLNETLAGNVAQDVASMLSAQACTQLRNKIGLNDRLMLLNDLFGNDADLYERTLDALDGAESLDDAYIYLSEHFALDDEKEGVKLLISLLEAKFN